MHTSIRPPLSVSWRFSQDEISVSEKQDSITIALKKLTREEQLQFEVFTQKSYTPKHLKKLDLPLLVSDYFDGYPESNNNTWVFRANLPELIAILKRLKAIDEKTATFLLNELEPKNKSQLFSWCCFHLKKQTKPLSEEKQPLLSGTPPLRGGLE